MIPKFDENGYLPLGIHFCDWEEFKVKFGYNFNRERMINGLELVLTLLKTAGCRTVYVDGSFISSKEKPGDFDACWEEEGVNMSSLKALAPTLYSFSLQRVEQKRKYKGEIFPANYPANDSGIVYVDFFQLDTRTNIRKGIIAIDLQRWEP